MSKTVALSAGHGHGDVGATYRGLQEATLTVRIAKRTTDILIVHGVGVLYVPDNLTLTGTIGWINQRAAQTTLCIDVHINSGGGTGVEAWHYAGAGQSKILSQHLANAMAAETGLRNRGVKDERTNRHGRLGFVHDTKPLAALVECGFIDGDHAFLNSSSGVEKMARGVARGCLSYLGIGWDPAKLNPKPAPPATIDHRKAVEESKPYVFGYKTHGTVTERMANIINIYTKHGITK